MENFDVCSLKQNDVHMNSFCPLPTSVVKRSKMEGKSLCLLKYTAPLNGISDRERVHQSLSNIAEKLLEEIQLAKIS